MLKRIRNRCRRIKWWFQRANGKVTPDEWWDFKYSLADYIRQGLEGLLYDGVTDWDSPTHKKEKEELEEILNWATCFPYMARGIIAKDSEDFDKLQKEFGDNVMIMTKDTWKEWEKIQERAFKLLAKNYYTLWD